MQVENLFNRVKYYEPMKDHTSFKVGGKVDIYFEPENTTELAHFITYLRRKDVPYYIIGNGTNLLVSDEGIRGAVVKIGNKMSSVEVTDEMIIAESGALLSALSKLALESSLSGLEFGNGIPGSVGGAITMNAGAYGCEIKDVFEKAEVLDESLNLKILNNKEMEFAYRKSILAKKEYIVLKSYFKLTRDSKSKIRKLMDELTKKRQSKQPIDLPSAGSIFKRPEGYYAAKLIEDAGLKGLALGDAQVSDKHSGFIVNKGNAAAKDIYNLIKHVQRTVYERYGVTLETEIKLLGEFE